PAAPLGQPLDRALEIELHDRRLAPRRGLHRALPVQRVGDPAHLRLPAAHVIEAVVERQTIQPRADRGIALEAAKLPVRLQENLLQEILAVLRRAAHPAGQRVNPRRVLPVERLERSRVAGLAPGDEIRIRPLVRSFRRERAWETLLGGGHGSRYEPDREKSSAARLPADALQLAHPARRDDDALGHEERSLQRFAPAVAAEAPPG